MSDAIRVEGLTKLYARYADSRRFATFKSALLRGSLLGDLEPEQVFPAIQDMSFRVGRGETLAVIGPNGSGKSTLLKVLAGILRPTRGRVEVSGRVAALIELGAGFHPEVSGRENVVLNGIMLGLSRREIERRMPDIVRFSGLEAFLDAPVKTYSSGMYVRLGFSVAVAVEPDVLLVDEVLAVGDEAFSRKCIDRFQDLKRRGTSILLVTHALELAESLADRAILVEGGRITAEGAPREVIDRYRGHVDERAGRALGEDNQTREAAALETGTGSMSAAAADAAGASPDSWLPRRWGNGAIEIRSLRLLGADGQPQDVHETGQPVTLELDIHASERQQDFVFGIAIWTRDGQLAYGTNTDLEQFRPQQLAGPAQVRIEFAALPLLAGSYSLDVAVHRKDGTAFDYRRACHVFEMRSAIRDLGIARLAHRWSFSGGVEIEPR